MEKELLSPDTLTEVLKTRRLELITLLELKLKAQKNLPKGHLRIEQKKGGRAPQYYHFTDPANTHGTYIPAAKLTLAHRLAQKDYDHKLIQIIQKQLSLIEKLILATIYYAVIKNFLSEMLSYSVFISIRLFYFHFD